VLLLRPVRDGLRSMSLPRADWAKEAPAAMAETGGAPTTTPPSTLTSKGPEELDEATRGLPVPELANAAFASSVTWWCLCSRERTVHPVTPSTSTTKAMMPTMAPPARVARPLALELPGVAATTAAGGAGLAVAEREVDATPEPEGALERVGAALGVETDTLGLRLLEGPTEGDIPAAGVGIKVPARDLVGLTEDDGVAEAPIEVDALELTAGALLAGEGVAELAPSPPLHSRV
jgi:hypothetical protein